MIQVVLAEGLLHVLGHLVVVGGEQLGIFRQQQHLKLDRRRLPALVGVDVGLGHQAQPQGGGLAVIAAHLDVRVHGHVGHLAHGGTSCQGQHTGPQHQRTYHQISPCC
ncbi:hypothetical protein D3C84_1080530 [compost metagenome]